MVNANTIVYGCIGAKDDPLCKLSVTLHNALFDRHNYNAILVPMNIDPAFLESGIYTMRSDFIKAIELSPQFSRKSLPYVDLLMPSARVMGMADFIYWKDNVLTGDNSMMLGFDMAVMPPLIPRITDNTKKLVIIYGTGNAAQMTIDRLAEFTANFTIISRNPNSSNPNMERIEKILENHPNTNMEVLGYSDAMPEPNDIIVNATPVGSGINKASVFDFSPTTENFVPNGSHFMVDWAVNMNGGSAFTALASSHGADYVTGNTIFSHVLAVRHGELIDVEPSNRSALAPEILNMLSGMVKKV